MSGTTTSASNDLVLTVDGTNISGWTAFELTRSATRVPMTLRIKMADAYWNDPTKQIVQPGKYFTASLGGQRVMTGLTVGWQSFVNDKEHYVELICKSLVSLLVKASALYNVSAPSATTNIGLPNFSGGMTTFSNNFYQLAVQFGSVLRPQVPIRKLTEKANQPMFPGTNLTINYGETMWEVLYRNAACLGVLMYDDENGNLVLAEEATTPVGSIIDGMYTRCEAEYNFDERFSDYYAILNSSVSRISSTYSFHQANGYVADIDMHRLNLFIPKAIFSENNISPQLRIMWEMNHRIGESQKIKVVLPPMQPDGSDAWKDPNGNLWQPNTIVKVNLPNAKVQSQNLVITEVVYRKSVEEGTTTEITMQPQYALNPSPVPPPVNQIPATAGIIAGSPQPSSALIPNTYGQQQ